MSRLPVCAALAAPVIAVSSVVASVEFTSDPPLGSTSSGNFVDWSLSSFAEPGHLDFDVSLGAGLDGNAVVTTMKGDMDSFANPFAGANSTVDGNRLLIPGASSGWYAASPQVGLTMKVNGNGNGGFEPLDLPLSIPQSDNDWIVVLILGDMVNPTDPVGFDGSVGLDILIGNTSMEATVAVDRINTPEDILAEMNRILIGLIQPADTRYDFVEGFPTFFLTRSMEVDLHLSVDGDVMPTFFVGGLVAPPIPEPTSLALVGAGLLALLRRGDRIRA